MINFSNPANLILLNVVGTNGTTRQQRVVTERFNGAGQRINQTGQAIGAGLQLNLGGAPAPDFPQAEYVAAQQAGDRARIQAIMAAHTERVTAWQGSSQGGSPELQIAKACLDFCVREHGFLTEDGDGFVLKLENLDVKVDELKDSRAMVTVAGTAVFGGE